MTRTRFLLRAIAGALLVGTIACKSKEEVLKAAEEKGQLIAEKKARLVKGIGEGLQNEGKAASEALAKGSAQVIRGGASGAVEGFSNLPISVAEVLTMAGVRAERAAIHRDDPKVPAVKVYLVLDKPYKGDLTLLASTQQGSEVGRSKISVDEQATGKYLVFSFDPLVDLSIATHLELR